MDEIGHRYFMALPVLNRHQGSESGNEEVLTWIGSHVDGHFTKIVIHVARESKRGCDSRHGNWHQMVQVAEVGLGDL